jgi:hypothetical protein
VAVSHDPLSDSSTSSPPQSNRAHSLPARGSSLTVRSWCRRSAVGSQRMASSGQLLPNHDPAMTGRNAPKAADRLCKNLLSSTT